MELFKTDGIRLTNIPELCRLGYRLGYAQRGKSKIVLGCDNRPDSERIAKAVCGGLRDAEVDVLYVGAATTPCVQWVTRYCAADGGVVVTASHNTAEYNGLKFVGAAGDKPTAAEIAELEAAIDTAPDGEEDKLPAVNPALVKAYCETLSAEVTKGLRIALDCANGVGYAMATRVLGKGSEELVYLHHGDGKAVNRDCGALHPESLRETVLRQGLDAGFALDGDGDRCVAVTKQGRVLDGDGILYLLALWRAEQGAPAHDGVVGTVMTNGALGRALREKGIRLYRSDVGDGHVRETMLAKGCALGAEPSGHVLWEGAPSDGLRTALLLCRIIAQRDIDEMLASYTPCPQHHATMPYSPAVLALAKKAGDKWQDYLGQTGRVVVRRSGTEPVVRLMVECPDEALADTVLKGIMRSASERKKGTK